MISEKHAPSPEKERMRLRGLRANLEKRAKIIAAIRRYFTELGFLEVETPNRIQAPAPEAHIDAVESDGKYLITSPELHMKRLLAAGYDKIFQIVHCHRDGERGERHLPEFAMIEWYRAESSIEDLMQDCEEMIQTAAEELHCYPSIDYQDKEIYLRPPWPVLKVADQFEKHAGWRPDGNPDPDKFNTDLVEKVEPALPADRPCFLSDYPASMASLANLYKNSPNFALRFELYAGGLELANGFDELTDPKEQRRRFESENAKRVEAGKSPYPIDENFLGALESGMPPGAGIALGLDRLIMLLTNSKTIDEVVAFPSE